MKIDYNIYYKQTLEEYNLSDNFSYNVDLLENSTRVLKSEILDTELGITVSCIDILTPLSGYEGETQSIMEDSENHFHVDWGQFSSEKESFMHGSKTLFLLAKKFEDEGYIDIRFWYQFQSSKQSIMWHKQNNIYDPTDEYCVSDRLSFYRMRKDDFITEEHNKLIKKLDSYSGFLFIEI